MQMPSITKWNKIFIITIVSGFVLQSLMGLANFPLLNYFGLSLSSVLSGKIWGVATYALFPHSILECLFDALIFWFIGSELEGIWGEKRYLSFIATIILGAGFGFLLISALFLAGGPYQSLLYSGPAGVASALCVAYGLLFPTRTMYFFMFPLQAKWFVTIIIAMNLYQGIFTPGGIFAWAQLMAMLSGFLWMVFIARYSKGNELRGFSVPGLNPKQNQTNAKPHARSRTRSSKISHLHIVEDPEDDDKTPPTYH